jgi:2,3-bisphosphoglycerate-independent phosphoglycerate mutase
MLIMPDHPTLLRTKTHERGPVPVAIAGTGMAPSGAPAYDEFEAKKTGLRFERGWELMPFFLK